MVISSLVKVVGVDIGITTINICHFNKKMNLFQEVLLKSPKPLMPGAVTIELCEYFKCLENKKCIEFVGISLPVSLHHGDRLVGECSSLSGWSDVPFADWLEVRLGTKVVLSNSKQCELLGTTWDKFSSSFEGKSFASVGVARLAYEKFVRNVAPF
tara:strand:- start:1277 stop:1744 length:468 start_codon:yes stop_codon:yes gene_type:complete